jgi:hypothetical protein
VEKPALEIDLDPYVNMNHAFDHGLLKKEPWFWVGWRLLKICSLAMAPWVSELLENFSNMFWC